MYKDNIRRQHEDDVTKKIKLSFIKETKIKDLSKQLCKGKS